MKGKRISLAERKGKRDRRYRYILKNNQREEKDVKK